MSPSLNSPARLILLPTLKPFMFAHLQFCALSVLLPAFARFSYLTKMMCKHLRLPQQTLVSTTKPQPWLCSRASRELPCSCALRLPRKGHSLEPLLGQTDSFLPCLMCHHWDRKTNPPSSRPPSQTKYLNSPLYRGSDEEESISSPSPDALSVCPSPPLVPSAPSQ